jgi:peptidoglycan lytic transglycosylase
MNDLFKFTKRFSVPALKISGAAVFLLLTLSTHSQADQCGRASWYALDGRRTANGEIMNSRRMTAAHRTLRFGTRVRVHNRRNGRSVVVRINDRGPFIRGRIIDLSRSAARRLGFLGRGSTRVCLSRQTRKKRR